MGSGQNGSGIIMRKNHFYDLFTNKEIPDEEERRAVNCHCADLIVCDKKVANRCRWELYHLWRKCPKQTNRTYKKQEESL